MNTLDERHWTRVQTIARAAAYQLATGSAKSPADAVAQVDDSLRRARRADAEWLVEQFEDRITEDFPAVGVGEGPA